MARTSKGRAGIAGIVVGLVLAVAPGVASAATGTLLAPCAGQAGSHPFAQFLDPLTYVLAPNGDLESGSAGWALKGASVVAGNEPFLASGTHALALPGGSSATSPAMCVGITHPTVRFFAVNRGFLLSTLKVDAVYTDTSGLLRTLPLGVVTGLPGWKPTLPMLALGDLVNPLLADGSAQVAFRFTPLLGGDWRVDDVFVDPWMRG
jgi:hypothetical protein